MNRKQTGQLETEDAAWAEVRRRAFKEAPWLKQGEMSSPRREERSGPWGTPTYAEKKAL